MAVRKQIASAIDILVHLGRMHDGRRKVLEISEVLSCRDGEIETNPLYVLRDDDMLCRTGNVFVQQKKLRSMGWQECEE